MNLAVQRRILHGVGATALGPLTTAIIQVVSVPVFLHYWGARLYGEWLVLSAIPTYLGMTDFGFGGVAANEMTMQTARQDRRGALETFQSTWLLTTAVSFFVSVVVALLVLKLPLIRWLHLAIMTRNEAVATAFLLSLYVVAGLQSNLIAAGFRCDGRYALGMLLGNLTRLFELVALVVAVALTPSPVFAAMVLLAVRLAGICIYYRILQANSHWLCFGFAHASHATLRRLVGPAIAYVALPAGNSLGMQGMIVVVGMVLGPLSVVSFSALRTLARLGTQLVSTIHLAVWPELSTAQAKGDRHLARLLHQCACQASVTLSLSASVALMLFGKQILSFWTHGSVQMNYGVFVCLLIATVTTSMWSASSVTLLASNKHSRYALFYIAATALCLVLAWALMLRLGLFGAALALLVLEIACATYVVRSALNLLGDRFPAFAGAMLHMPASGCYSVATRTP